MAPEEDRVPAAQERQATPLRYCPAEHALDTQIGEKRGRWDSIVNGLPRTPETTVPVRPSDSAPGIIDHLMSLIPATAVAKKEEDTTIPVQELPALAVNVTAAVGSNCT